MRPTQFRIVIDTNTLLRSLIVSTSAAAKIRRAAEKRIFIPLLSKPVLDEYRAVLLDKAIVERFPEITPRVVDITVRRLHFVSDYLRSPKVRFEFLRDVADQKFIELAIGLKATHILSSDKDLLSLPRGRSDAGRRFRQRLPEIEVLAAEGFIQKYAIELGLE